MRAPGLGGSFWPSRRQELLLRAALADREPALRAWEELRPQLDLQTLEGSGFAALPLVYRTLETAGADDPDLPRLKGIYRSVWARNNLLLARLAASAAALDRAAVPFLLVGSIGTAVRSYPALGLRPTPYLELLVRDGAAALGALERAGWNAGGAGPPTRAAATVLRGGEDDALVLRTALAPDFVVSGGADAHDPLWDAATKLDVRGTAVPALSATDDLLAAIVTGARAAPGAPIQWLLDAATILRGPEALDWERLLRLGTESGQALRLRDALAYLTRLLGPVVLDDVRARLGAHRPTGRERLAHVCAGRSVAGLGSLPQALGQHLAETAGSSAWTTVAALPSFLRRRWRLDHGWQVPVAGARRAYRLLARTRGAA